MRFMMIVKATQDSEAGKLPSEQLLEAMGKYNEQLMKAGVLRDLNGLQPTSKGARVKFSGGKPTVVDGPFAETKEYLGGVVVLALPSLDDAVASLSEHPALQFGVVIEIRPIAEEINTRWQAMQRRVGPA